ncbi:MAG TPA: non-ribosomal peptide synthetase, partial [Acidobacteriota bacterium]|nr:non-ribosomal peptide synthetase [Acidobacteriota bacterium]
RTGMTGTKGSCRNYVETVWTDMIPAGVREQLRHERSRIDRSDNGKCVHELFELQAQKTPGAVVMRCGDRELTYGELNARSNQLGRFLRARGVGPEVVVGVAMQRSLETIVVLYGILKAGGAYVVIDPLHPPVRIKDIIMQSGISLAIAGSDDRRVLSSAGLEIIDLDEAESSIRRESDRGIISGATADNLAYITFTSGSSGKPKGVMGIHRSITNGFTCAYFERGRDGETCCLMAPLGFAASVFTMLLPPCWGIPVVVIPEGRERDPWYVARAIEQFRVTSTVMVPSFFRQLAALEKEARRSLKSVKTLALSGSAVTPDCIGAVKRIMPDAYLTVSYSSSEAGGVVTAEGMDVCSLSEKVRFGRIVPNTRVYILDETMHPAMGGREGEIYIAADHISRGYSGDPVLTAESFLPDPFAPVPGRRCYRTGDRGRFLPDGRVELLGRCDNQVKIRGFRIELDDIQSALSCCPHVGEAAVISRMVAEEQRLVAYLTPKAGNAASVTAIRRYLRQRLPEYMIPGTFVFVDRFPLTPHGKVDVHSLPEPDGQRPPLECPNEPPRNALETALSDLWKSLLGLDQIGIHDDFLDLGGDSITAAQAVFQLKERYGVDVPVVNFFDYMTIADLAAEISTAAPWLLQVTSAGSAPDYLMGREING